MVDLKAIAHKQVNEAIRDGRLRRPELCENCGLDGFSSIIVAHHPDYSKPLEVEWLCYSCHGVAHARGRRPPVPWPAHVVVPPGVLTFAEAADLYGVSPALIVTCAARGLVKRWIFHARDVVERSDVERVFARSRRVRERLTERQIPA